jgi:hypothetical protein
MSDSYRLRSELVCEDTKNDSFIGGKELYTHHDFTHPSIRAYIAHYKFGTVWA